jgi:hypothetical protein
MLAFVSNLLEKIVQSSIDQTMDATQPSFLVDVPLFGQVPNPNERAGNRLNNQESWIFHFSGPSQFMARWLECDELKECGLLLVGYENEGYEIVATSQYRFEKNDNRYVLLFWILTSLTFFFSKEMYCQSSRTLVCLFQMCHKKRSNRSWNNLLLARKSTLLSSRWIFPT